MSYEKFFPRSLSRTLMLSPVDAKGGSTNWVTTRPSRYEGERSLEFEMMPSGVVVGGDLQRHRQNLLCIFFGFMAIIDIFVLCKPAHS